MSQSNILKVQSSNSDKNLKKDFQSKANCLHPQSLSHDPSEPWGLEGAGSEEGRVPGPSWEWDPSHDALGGGGGVPIL